MLELTKSVNITNYDSKTNYLLVGVLGDVLYIKNNDKITRIEIPNNCMIEYVLTIELSGAKREFIFEKIVDLYAFEKRILSENRESLEKNFFNIGVQKAFLPT